MLYDHNATTNLAELQVVAATGLIQRSVDNEIALTAQNLRLQNIVKQLSEELARVRNTDVAGLNTQLSELQTRLNVVTEEREQALQQFATVKQREGTLKEEIKTLKQTIGGHEGTIADLRLQVEKPPKKPAAKPAASR